MRYAIVDDIPEDRDALAAAVDDYCARHDAAALCEHFDTVEAFRRSWRPGRFDLVFLDGYFAAPRTSSDADAAASPASGIDAARWLRARGYDGPIVMTTVSTDFAVDGYEAGVAAYLVKPFGRAQLGAALDRLNGAAQASRASRRDVVSGCIVELPVGARAAAALAARVNRAERGGKPSVGAVASYAVVALADDEHILRFDAARMAYCHADAHTVIVHNADEQAEASFTVRAGFTRLERELARWRRFLTCARGWIVNLDHVVGIDADSFLVSVRDSPSGSATLAVSDAASDDVGGTAVDDAFMHVPISRRRYAEAKARYAEHRFARMRRTDYR